MHKVKISATIANEFLSRYPDNISEKFFEVGVHDATDEELLVLLEDAEFNADAVNGPEEMPSGVRRAYRSLAAQIRKLV